MSTSALQTYFAHVLQLQQQQVLEAQCLAIVSDQHRSHAAQEQRIKNVPDGGLVRQHSEQRWQVCEDSSSSSSLCSPSMAMIRKTASRRPSTSSIEIESTIVVSKPIAVRWSPTDSVPDTSTRGRPTTAQRASVVQGDSGLKIPQRCESPPPTCRSRSPSISPSDLHQFRRYNSCSPLYEQKNNMCESYPATSSWSRSLSPESSPSLSSACTEYLLKDEDKEKLWYHQALNVASAHCSCASPPRKTVKRRVFPHAA